jgi:hypothetical protein
MTRRPGALGQQRRNLGDKHTKVWPFRDPHHAEALAVRRAPVVDRARDSAIEPKITAIDRSETSQSGLHRAAVDPRRPRLQLEFAARTHILAVRRCQGSRSMPHFKTTPIRVSEEDAVFEPERLQVALRRALSEMVDGMNLIVDPRRAEETAIIVPDLSSTGIVLREDAGPVVSGGAFVAPLLTADQLGVALRDRDPVEVSAAWAKGRIPHWAKALSDATALHAASAFILRDVRETLAAAATDGKPGCRTLVSEWLRARRADGHALGGTVPYLIGHLGSGSAHRRLPSFSLEEALPYRIPKAGEFLALNLMGFTKTARAPSANSDTEIVGKVSFAAAAAFLASRYGARVAPRIHYDDPSEWGRPMESLTDVLRFIVSTSGIMDDPSSYDGTSFAAPLSVIVDTGAGTARLVRVGADMSGHAKLALRHGVISRRTIVRDPVDFLPVGKVGDIGVGIVLATLDALIENEERLAAGSPRGWRSRALKRALGTLAFRHGPGGGLRGDCQGLRLLSEHCRRTGKDIDDIIPRTALPAAIRRAQAHGVDFTPELCRAADRRAHLPTEHPDRLWMITERRTVTGVAWSAVIGPELRLVPVAWLRGTLTLDNLIN